MAWRLQDKTNIRYLGNQLYVQQRFMPWLPSSNHLQLPLNLQWSVISSDLVSMTTVFNWWKKSKKILVSSLFYQVEYLQIEL